MESWTSACARRPPSFVRARAPLYSCRRLRVVRVEERRTIGADHVGIEPRARLQCPLERVVVDVHEAKPLRVSEAPLEVVEQRPGEVAAQVDTLPQGEERGTKVLAVVPDAERIVNTSVDRRRRVTERRTVLGDVERDVSVALAYPEQRPRQRRRVGFPTGLGVDVLRLLDVAGANGLRRRVVPRDA